MNPPSRNAIAAALIVVVLACMRQGSDFAEKITRVFSFASQSSIGSADATANRIDD